MKAVVQRVTSASVTVDEDKVAEIGPGLLVLLGVATGDGPEQAERMAGKLVNLRIFPDREGKISEPLGSREILCVSQFTLFGDTSRGNRPGFSAAASPEDAEPLYEAVCDRIGASRGVFGANMRVEMAGDGPVTLIVET